MKYDRLKKAIFIKRPNRFTAFIRIEGKEELCHVKNTGRLGELLLEGAELLVEPAQNPQRKTKYSMICVKKEGQWINIDSQASNKVAEEWIKKGGLFPNVKQLKREQKYGTSRFDFYAESSEEKWFIEVKGVTLNVNGTAMFPDAPTERGKKHVEELIACQKEGYHGCLLFVIQMKGVNRFTPFQERQPDFAEALKEAKACGVDIFAVDCLVEEDGLQIDQRIPVYL